MHPVLLLVARILLAAVFVYGGFGKLMGAEGFAGYLGSLGVPGGIAMAYLVGAFELVAGVLVLVGFQPARPHSRSPPSASRPRSSATPAIFRRS